MEIDEFTVYIIAYKINTVFYTGVTSDLFGRILQHKQKTFKGFTAKYDCDKLVYFEQFQWIQDAIDREKQIKAGSRKKKINLIIKDNPGWNDLSEGWYN